MRDHDDHHSNKNIQRKMGNMCKGKANVKEDSTSNNNNNSKKEQKRINSSSIHHGTPNFYLESQSTNTEMVQIEEYTIVNRKSSNNAIQNRNLSTLGPSETIEINNKNLPKTIPTPIEVLARKSENDNVDNHNNDNNSNNNSTTLNKTPFVSFVIEWGYFQKEEAETILLETWNHGNIENSWKDNFPKETIICNLNVDWIPAQDVVKDCSIPMYLQEPAAVFHPTEDPGKRLDNNSIRRKLFPVLYEVFDLILSSSLKHLLLYHCFIKIEDILAKEQSIIVNDNNEDDEENSNDEKVLIPSFCICLHRNYVAEYFIVDNHVPIFGERDNDDNGGCLEHEYWSLIIEKALAKQYNTYENINNLEFHQIFHSLTGKKYSIPPKPKKKNRMYILSNTVSLIHMLHFTQVVIVNI